MFLLPLTHPFTPGAASWSHLCFFHWCTKIGLFALFLFFGPVLKAGIKHSFQSWAEGTLFEKGFALGMGKSGSLEVRGSTNYSSMKGEMVGCFRKSLNMQGTYCCLSLICASEQGILYRKGGTETSVGKNHQYPETRFQDSHFRYI